MKIEFICYHCLKCHKNQACSIILAWVNYKVAKNCLKVGKIMILCSGFGKFWKSAILQAVAHQNLVKWPLAYLYYISEKSYPARGGKDIVTLWPLVWPFNLDALGQIIFLKHCKWKKMDDMKVMFMFIRVMWADESYVPVNESYHYKMAFGLCAWKQT